MNDAEVVEQARIRARLQRLSWLMDNSVRLPTGHRVGIDGLIGLIPGIGDLLGASVSGYLIFQAHRLGAPRTLLARMALNVATETVLGTIPLLGDLFDLGFKANARNYRLVEKYLSAPARHGQSTEDVPLAQSGLQK